jgi:GTP-binding protein
LNSLIGSRLAHVSSTPGRTRTINFFAISWNPRQFAADVLLADLPGYGYAKISRAVSAQWPRFIEPYLQKRPTLALCIALVDATVEPQVSDRKLLDFLRSAGRNFIVVATKSDRISRNQLAQSLRQLSHALAVERILPYSSKTNAGREELWREIRHACAHIDAAGA